MTLATATDLILAQLKALVNTFKSSVYLTAFLAVILLHLLVLRLPRDASAYVDHVLKRLDLPFPLLWRSVRAVAITTFVICTFFFLFGLSLLV